MWHDLQSVSRTVAAAESATLPESACSEKTKNRSFTSSNWRFFWPNVHVVVTENCHYGGLSQSQMLCCHSKVLTMPSDGLLISSHQSHIDFPLAAVFINKNFKPNSPSPVLLFVCQRFLWRRNLELRKFINKPSIKFHNRCDPCVLKLNTFSGRCVSSRGQTASTASSYKENLTSVGDSLFKKEKVML